MERIFLAKVRIMCNRNTRTWITDVKLENNLLIKRNIDYELLKETLCWSQVVGGIERVDRPPQSFQKCCN